MIDILQKIELFSCLYMFGVIVFVQIVHYPLFINIDPESFPVYERLHQMRTSFVVIIPMIAELFSSLGLFYLSEPRATSNFSLVILLLIIWASTFFLQVPLHHRLETSGYNKEVIIKLYKTNWIRTFCWGIRAISLMFL